MKAAGQASSKWAATMMQMRSPRVWFSKKFRVAISVAFLSLLALVRSACTHRPAPTPTQAQAPTAAQTQIATDEKAIQVPLRANCGGQNQPPCGPPDCGVLNEERRTGNACRGAGLVCKNGVCIPKGGACGGLGDPCCVNKNPMCSNYLLKCVNNVCCGGNQVRIYRSLSAPTTKIRMTTAASGLQSMALHTGSKPATRITITEYSHLVVNGPGAP